MSEHTTAFDCHLHSHNSHDGWESLDDIIKVARGKGLAGIALTDHCDADKGDAGCVSVFRGTLADVERSRAELGASFKLLAGAELGEPHHVPDAAAEVSGHERIDFVLGSLHTMRGVRNFYHIDYRTADIDSLFAQYYDELLEMAETADFDSMAHINYQIRYMPGAVRDALDLSRYSSRLTPVLAALAKRGMGVEFNMSTEARPGNVVPGVDVLREFKSLGGKVVTIGSDAHRRTGVGLHMDEAAHILREAGFTQAAYFERRRPVFYDI